MDRRLKIVVPIVVNAPLALPLQSFSSFRDECPLIKFIPMKKSNEYICKSMPNLIPLEQHLSIDQQPEDKSAPSCQNPIILCHNIQGHHEQLLPFQSLDNCAFPLCCVQSLTNGHWPIHLLPVSDIIFPAQVAFNHTITRGISASKRKTTEETSLLHPIKEHILLSTLRKSIFFQKQRLGQHRSRKSER